MRRFNRFALETLTALVFAFALAPSAQAFDITGTWQGSYKCKGVDDGVKEAFEDALTANITQNGTQVGADISFDGDIYKYNGLAVANADKPDKGNLALVICGTDDDLSAGVFDEYGRFSVSTKPSKGSGTIKGVSQYSAPDLDIYTCKWKLTRTNTTNAGVSPSCPD